MSEFNYFAFLANLKNSPIFSQLIPFINGHSTRISGMQSFSLPNLYQKNGTPFKHRITRQFI